MTFAISTAALRYRAGSFEIPALSLHVPEGAIYGFLGPNGAGKTTTVRLLLGLIRPAGGRITVLGHDVPGETPAMLARTGYVPERPHLYPTLTVAEALRFHAAFHHTRWDRVRAAELLRRFNLDEQRPVGHLSKGETGKLMILLALAQTPELLVLDEPTDGLDPVVRREALMALLDYVSERHATVFISSHLVHELERICDWVGVLDRGHLAAEMPMEQFKGGIKRLRVTGAPRDPRPMPFVLLGREADPAGETWTVRGWEAPMRGYFDSAGTALRDVADLDLEDAFVELLRASRAPQS